ncbi:GNAT family N-acetyltransferase [Dongia deserti]|uniref:GNAT family N-acetyltransferase n=1 Tax=Dongia deserti TaxID=2268030 RepID=UPI000E65244E|nr:GNAT family N-acetyltransferase [Dongia deserti]
MDFVIRPYTPADRDWVLECEVALQEHERAIHDTRLPGLPHSRDYLALLWDVLAENNGIMLIAETAEGERVGLVAGHVVDEPWPVETRDSTRYGYVSDIYIRPEARSAGLAKALLDASAAHLHQSDPTLTRLRVNVLAVNTIACRAYEKAGFTPYEVMYERRLGPIRS